jgi:hypothetical protein
VPLLARSGSLLPVDPCCPGSTPIASQKRSRWRPRSKPCRAIAQSGSPTKARRTELIVRSHQQRGKCGPALKAANSRKLVAAEIRAPAEDGLTANVPVGASVACRIGSFQGSVVWQRLTVGT